MQSGELFREMSLVTSVKNGLKQGRLQRDRRQLQRRKQWRVRIRTWAMADVKLCRQDNVGDPRSHCIQV